MTISTGEAHHIATTLCVLAARLHLTRSQAESTLSSVTLNTRVGRGLKTYCRFKPQAGAVITFGQMMVIDQLRPGQAQRWLTGREMLNRGYFAGVLTPATVFSHVVLHEYAHVEQVMTGGRSRNSVHNAPFYAILDEYYALDLHNEVRDRLREYARLPNFDLDQRLSRT